MEQYKIYIGVGLVIMLLGIILLSRNTIYLADYGRTALELGIKFVVLLVGYLVYRRGIRMRDDSRTGSM